MELERRFTQTTPDALFLSVDNKDTIAAYLNARGQMRSAEVLQHLEKAGEGNMNCVLRALTNYGTFILKQSRPWVEKYPQIDAPIDRINVEATYLALVQSNRELKKFTPALRFHDRQNFLILMEDLGGVSDYTYLYQENQFLYADDLNVLMYYLDMLHQVKAVEYPDNIEMRILNHQHIFQLPYQKNNGLNLDEMHDGLSQLALPILTNEELRSKIDLLGQAYLQPGNTLIHGDYHLGSWLKTSTGIKVIDAEFSFKGFAEFDWSVLFAHMYMAEQNNEIIDQIRNHMNNTKALDLQKTEAYAGVEILRRFYGIAQLPLILDLDKKKHLTELAVNWIMEYKP